MIGFIFNAIAIGCFYWIVQRQATIWDTSYLLGPTAHLVFWYLTVLCLVIAIPCYFLSVCLDPGMLKSQFDFTEIISQALETNLALDSFCSYCEVIVSETSFHCFTCGKCVELFDHHCPFINNCLGYRNHKYFLVFLCAYALFLIIMFVETVRHFAEVFSRIGWSCLKTDTTTSVIMIGLWLHMPILIWQLYMQCKNLNNTPRKLIEEEEPTGQKSDQAQLSKVNQQNETGVFASLKHSSGEAGLDAYKGEEGSEKSNPQSCSQKKDSIGSNLRPSLTAEEEQRALLQTHD